MSAKEIEGKSVEEAIETACQRLDLPADQLEIEILSHGSSGIFGIGTRNAKILVSPKESGDETSLNEAREILEFIRYYRAMIGKFDIPLHLNTSVDTDLIQTRNPDYIVLAEGAEPLLPNIEGIDDPSVLSAWQVLKENPFLGKSVAVIGGGSVGLETALFVAAKGTITAETLHFLFTYEAESVERLRQLMFKGSSKVTVFEMLPKIGRDVGKSTKWILLDNLRRHRVSVRTSAEVQSIKNGLVTYVKDGETKKVQFDNVVLSAGSKQVEKLSGEIKQLGIPFAAVGDCVRPGRLNDAIHGGFLTALNI